MCLLAKERERKESRKGNVGVLLVLLVQYTDHDSSLTRSNIRRAIDCDSQSYEWGHLDSLLINILVISFFESVISLLKFGCLCKMEEPYSTARFGCPKWRGFGVAKSRPVIGFFESTINLIKVGSLGKMKEPHSTARFRWPKWRGVGGAKSHPVIGFFESIINLIESETF